MSNIKIQSWLGIVVEVALWHWCLQKDHLLWSDLDLGFVSKPNVLVSPCESLVINFYEVLFAQTSYLPSSNFKVKGDHGVLAWNWFIVQIQIYFVCFTAFLNTHLTKWSFLCSANKKYCVRDSLFKILRFKNGIEKFREVTNVWGYRKFRISMMMSNFFLMSNFSRLFSESNLLAPYNFKSFPTYFSMVLIKAFQVRTNIINDLSRLIFLNQTESS